MAKSFEEIAHSGGRIEFRRTEDGSYTESISNVSHGTSPRCYRVSVSGDGRLLDVLPVQGLGVPPRRFAAWVFSDAEGLFGRRCPRCDSYFRTDAALAETNCPYCGRLESTLAFSTPNQLSFIENYVNAEIAFVTGDEEYLRIDLDQLIDELEHNEPGWVYSEERQQSLFECSGCSTKFDILGEYGCCPCCGNHNAAMVVKAKFGAVAQDVGLHPEKAAEAEVPSEWLGRCVSTYEALAQHYRQHLLRLPMTPRRRQALEKDLNFQRIRGAAKRLDDWFGFRLLDGLTQDQQEFLVVMLEKRHVFVHNGGRADQRYLDKSGDTSARLNQTLAVTRIEIETLVKVLRRVCERLIREFDSIAQD